MSHGRANKLLLIAALLWGAGNVAQQTILESIGPFLAVGLRCVIACLVILPFTFRGKSSVNILAVLANRAGMLTILFFAVAVTLQQIAFGYTTVTNAGFIINTTTVITPIIAWAILRQRPETRIWPAAVLTLIGAGLLSGGSMRGANFGDLLCLAAALSYSLWMIFLGEFVIKNGNAARLTLLQFLLSGLICLTISFAFENISLANVKAALPELLVLGVFSTGVAYLLQSIAQKHTSAGEAAVITSGEALFGAMGAFIYLGERLSASGGAGAGLVLLGILILQLRPQALAAEHPAKILLQARNSCSRSRRKGREVTISGGTACPFFNQIEMSTKEKPNEKLY